MKTVDLTNKPTSKEEKMHLNRKILTNALGALVSKTTDDDEVIAMLEKRGINHYRLLPSDPESYPLT